jgi:hypothetical protein
VVIGSQVNARRDHEPETTAAAGSLFPEPCHSGPAAARSPRDTHRSQRRHQLRQPARRLCRRGLGSRLRRHRRRRHRGPRGAPDRGTPCRRLRRHRTRSHRAAHRPAHQPTHHQHLRPRLTSNGPLVRTTRPSARIPGGLSQCPRWHSSNSMPIFTRLRKDRQGSEPDHETARPRQQRSITTPGHDPGRDRQARYDPLPVHLLHRAPDATGSDHRL